MKNEMLIDNLKEIAAIITVVLGSIGSLIALWFQRRKDSAEAGSKDAEGDHLRAQATKTLVDTMSDSTKELITRYRELSEESIASARACKERMETLATKLDSVIQSNLELKQINGEALMKNEQLIRENENLVKKIDELERLVHVLSEQIKMMGGIPNIGKREEDASLLGEK